MAASETYMMLMAALPYYGPLFTAKQTPLSRLRLDQRLRVLNEEDAEQLKIIESLLQWDHFQDLSDDEEVAQRVKKSLPRVKSPLLQKVVQDRLEVRCLIAALRRRHAGESAPLSDAPWLIMPRRQAVIDNWRDKSFGLARRYSWLSEAADLVERGDPLALEQLILQQVWSHLARAADGHHFDFEAVAVYVLRWGVIERWVRYDKEAASARFAALLDEAMKGQDRVLAEGGKHGG